MTYLYVVFLERSHGLEARAFA